MKVFSGLLAILFSLMLISGCGGRGNSKKDAVSANDTVSVPDTGFTGIKQYMSGKYIVKEVTFKNGVQEGLTKTFYVSGKVRVTFMYEKGLRQDSARWYYDQGQLFRTTPYKNDTVDGIQKQFFRTGRLKAKIGFSKGLRTQFFQEFTPEGKLVSGYPQLVVSSKDEYKSKGTYRVILALTDKSAKVTFYRGDFSKGVFDTAHCQKINTIQGIGYLDLKKTGAPKQGSVGVIAEELTFYGNKNLIFKKIDLPYNDLN